MMSLLEKNLSVLKRRQPETAGLIEERERSPEVELRVTREGLPVHRYRGKLLHSEYDPRREAKHCTADFQNSNPWVIGFGDGYHLEALLENGRTEEMVVVEPDGGVLRAVLEDRDVRHVLEKARVLVEEPPTSFDTGWRLAWCGTAHPWIRSPRCFAIARRAPARSTATSRSRRSARLPPTGRNTRVRDERAPQGSLRVPVGAAGSGH